MVYVPHGAWLSVLHCYYYNCLRHAVVCQPPRALELRGCASLLIAPCTSTNIVATTKYNSIPAGCSAEALTPPVLLLLRRCLPTAAGVMSSCCAVDVADWAGNASIQFKTQAVTTLALAASKPSLGQAPHHCHHNRHCHHPTVQQRAHMRLRKQTLLANPLRARLRVRQLLLEALHCRGQRQRGVGRVPDGLLRRGRVSSNLRHPGRHGAVTGHQR